MTAGGWGVEATLPVSDGRGDGPMTIRVLIADDQAMVRAGFAMILAAEDDIDVVARPRTACSPWSSPELLPARRGADGHPDAPHGRSGGAAQLIAPVPWIRRRSSWSRRSTSTITSSGAARRRLRIPDQGLRPGSAGRGHQGGGRRRGADQPAITVRLLRRLNSAVPRPGSRTPHSPRGRRTWCAGGQRTDQRRDRRRTVHLGGHGEDAPRATSRSSSAPATGWRSPRGPGTPAWSTGGGRPDRVAPDPLPGADLRVAGQGAGHAGSQPPACRVGQSKGECRRGLDPIRLTSRLPTPHHP